MVRETGVQSQVESYQRLKKWNLMPHGIIRRESRVKWSNPEKGVAPSSTSWCRSYRKGKPFGHHRLRSPTVKVLRINSRYFSRHSVLILFSILTLRIWVTGIYTYTRGVWIPISSCGSLCGVRAKVMNCGLEVCEFKLQLRCYVHFQTPLGKAWSSLSP